MPPVIEQPGLRGRRRDRRRRSDPRTETRSLRPRGRASRSWRPSGVVYLLPGVLPHVVYEDGARAGLYGELEGVRGPSPDARLLPEAVE